jgi:regulator of extracellular matrix RemA (YlzA/DUF370 family)
MSFDAFFNIFAGIVSVAAITAIVQSPNTAPIIRAFGDAFGGSIRAALGR